jgi:hypothetical protein
MQATVQSAPQTASAIAHSPIPSTPAPVERQPSPIATQSQIGQSQTAQNQTIVALTTPRHSRAATHAENPAFLRPSAPQSVLMITAIPGADSCASSLAAALGVPVEIASSRKVGLSALRRRDFATVIVDDSIAEADPAGTELIWKHSGLAVPLQINFAVVGCARLGREVRAALARREQEESLAMRAATSNLENDLKSTLAGLLLNSELALAEPSVPPQLASKLQLMVELAGTLRRRLEQPHI